ncbi:hypothetical protein L218DRAFT_1010042 [Marasmius fiardii PR-910]|nr:hypothetical protein L218DRAFT_1010042 [Marasmius fiardii PR-910]
MEAVKKSGTKCRAPTCKSTCASTVSIPYAEVPGMDTSSHAYIWATLIFLKAASNANSSGAVKKVRIETAISNLQEESAVEATQCLLDSQQISRLTSLVPFFPLESLEGSHLISISNFLRSELSTLSHAVKYYSKQYEFMHNQLKEVNHTQLSKMAISDAPADSGNSNDMPVSSPSGSQASEGSAQPQNEFLIDME